jgi:hypothetical protein
MPGVETQLKQTAKILSSSVKQKGSLHPNEAESNATHGLNFGCQQGHDAFSLVMQSTPKLFDWSFQVLMAKIQTCGVKHHNSSNSMIF